MTCPQHGADKSFEVQVSPGRKVIQEIRLEIYNIPYSDPISTGTEAISTKYQKKSNALQN